MSEEEVQAPVIKFKNKQRVLIVATRGIGGRSRHVMEDLRAIIPHSKREPKVKITHLGHDMNDILEDSGCNSCILFETRKNHELNLWMSRYPSGPTLRFHVKSMHTMMELKMIGNALKGSRAILSFDAVFDSEPAFLLMKEVFTHIFNVPKGHPRSKPFFDRILHFAYVDNKVWIRHYEILSEARKGASVDTTLAEIGPRLVLDLDRIFDGCFTGKALHRNPHFTAPVNVKKAAAHAVGDMARSRKEEKRRRKMQKKALLLPRPDEYDGLFE